MYFAEPSRCRRGDRRFVLDTPPFYAIIQLHSDKEQSLRNRAAQSHGPKVVRLWQPDYPRRANPTERRGRKVMGLGLTHGDQRQLRLPDLPKGKAFERWRRKVMGLKPQGHGSQTTE